MLFIYDFISRQWDTENQRLRDLVTGVIAGLVVTIIMLTSWQYEEGIIFDARSVLLGVSGLCLGVIPTFIAILMAVVVRIFLAGDGVIPGIGIIVSSGIIGVLWRTYRLPKGLVKLSLTELWCFGFALQFAYFASVFLFPLDKALQIFELILLPVLILYPLATMMLSYLFIDRLKQAQLSKALVLSEERTKGLYYHAPAAIWEEDWSAVSNALKNIQRDHPAVSISEYFKQHRDQAWELVSSIKIVGVNDAALKLSGAASKDQLTDGITQFFDQSTIEQFIDVIETFAQGEQVKECESIFVDLNGERRWIEVRHALMPGYEDSMGIVLITTLDITSLKQKEDALRLSSSVYENSQEAMSVTDESGTILSVNAAFSTITGYSQEEVLGKTHSILKSGKHDKRFHQKMWHEIITTGRWEGEISNRRKNGEIYAEWLSVNTICDENNQPYRRIALFSDISQRKASESLIERQANFDNLTGLPNRRMFIEHLNRQIDLALILEDPIQLLLIDLDRLTDINDSLGYLVGDELIKQSAVKIQDCLQAPHLVARIAGDVFAVILPGEERQDEIDRIVECIQAALATACEIDNHNIYLTSSIGIAAFPTHASTSEVLIQCSNLALENAKQQGRNQRSHYVPLMKQSTQYKYAVSTDLRKALASDQFRLFYQPIIDLKTQNVHKAEALIRWYHPVQGIISPADFIPVAEATGAIIEIGNWVFTEAVKQVESWRETIASDFQISINKSPIQFKSEDVHLSNWFDYLAQHGLSGEAIVVEMTEGLLMDSGPVVASKLFAMSDAGMQIALDDFGTGYSSLSYIKKYDVDYLKIDQAFVSNLTAESDDSAICESVIAMAHKLGIKVIAEGIETKEQLELLTQWGCDYGQGYYFCKPIPADQFEQKYAGLKADQDY
ncbi:signal transduction protein [Amphritea japonica ATCC BAA-1530]|uniref:Signal transduction protein n=2 Tax=Amphritea TaxID=515417 RepID=A0A7R6SSK2_9GAMM|nr:signal transduction protein [Amphritea japonica ATCC BAA-1530]